MKYEMQLIAEEIAEERHGCDFYELTAQQQHTVYTEAMELWTERRMP